MVFWVCHLHNVDIEDSTEKTKLLALIGNARKLNGERNGFVHAEWGPSTDPTRLTRFRSMLPRNTKERMRPIESFSVPDIQDVVDRIASLSNDFVQFQFDDAAKLVVRFRPLV